MTMQDALRSQGLTYSNRPVRFTAEAVLKNQTVKVVEKTEDSQWRSAIRGVRPIGK